MYTETDDFLALADKCERLSNGHGNSNDRECLMEAATAIRALVHVMGDNDGRQDAETPATDPADTAPANAAGDAPTPVAPTDPNPLPLEVPETLAEDQPRAHESQPVKAKPSQKKK